MLDGLDGHSLLHVPMILAALFCRSCSARSSHGEENWTERSLLAQAPINQLFEVPTPNSAPTKS